MTITINTQAAAGKNYGSAGMQGVLIADATALPQMTLGAISAAQFASFSCDNNAGFIPSMYVQLNGTGASGANAFYMINCLGPNGGAPNTTQFSIYQVKPVTTAVASGLVVVPHVPVYTRFHPQTVELINLTTGDEYLWAYGMAPNTALKRAASGAKTLLADSGIIVDAKSFNFHQSMIAVGQQMAFKVAFATGAN